MNFDFGDVLSRAWEITWKHKLLWIYGFLQTMASFLFVPVAVIPAFAPLLSDRSGEIVNEPWFFLIFIVGFLVFILLLYPLSVLMNGVLSIGVLRVEQGEEKLSFMELIRESLPFFWRILGLMLLFTGVIVLAMLIFSLLQTVLSVLTLGFGAICLIPLSFLTYPLMFVWYVCMEQSLAAIVVDHMNVMDSTKQGWEIFRKNTGAIVVIGLVLYLGVSLIGGIAIVPMMVPFFAIPFALGVEEFNRNILLVAGICGVIYMPLFAIFQGALMAFMKSGWILTYRRLTRNPTVGPLLQEATA